MITKILIRRISKSPADYERIRRALELCKEKGYLSKHELLQLQEAGLPVRLILENILPPTEKRNLDSMIGLGKISYGDLMCVIGILAQDCRVQEQKRGIHI